MPPGIVALLVYGRSSGWKDRFANDSNSNGEKWIKSEKEVEKGDQGETGGKGEKGDEGGKGEKGKMGNGGEMRKG